ncbi:efflux RND transporter permease subunit, partial [Phycisphaera mikurensis]
PTLFFSLLIIMVSFLPIFVLDGQSGRLFKPLAYTKTFAMAAAAGVAVTLIPVVMVYTLREGGPRKWVAALCAVGTFGLFAFLPLGALEDSRWLVAVGGALAVLLLVPRQRISNEDDNPISRVIRAAYEPFFRFTMKHRALTILIAALLMSSTLYPWSKLGSEFMPPLEEGDLLYMPTTDPGISVSKATELLAQTDALIAAFPEVEHVFGKIGRAETATDPAPVSMLETTITLHRDEVAWRKRPVERFYSGWPGWLAWAPSKLLPPTRTITPDELIYGYELTDAQLGVDRGGRGFRIPGMNDALQIPGLSNAWTMPIRTRIDMLSTGIRTPVGVKIMGPDLTVLSDLAGEVADLLKTDERTRTTLASAFPDKTVGGNYLDLDVDREAIARYGLSSGDLADVVMTAVGGMNVTSTVEGLERYPVSLRYPRELRDDPESLEKVLVATPGGAQVPLGQLAKVVIRRGPPMIKSEDARPTSWVYVDIKDTDIGTFVEAAQAVVAERLELPPGYTVRWSGQYEYMQDARERLQLAIPLAAVVILLLLFVATRSWLRVGIVLLAVPFSLIGAAWFTWFLGYDMSLAVWVGVIALAGLDAETGLVMLLYLDDSHERFKREGRLNTTDDLMHAVHDGAVQRIRPKTMTVMTTFIGLMPLLFATGAGSDTMQRLAAPMIGGLATSFVAELLLYPVLFYSAKRIAMKRDAS